MIYILLTTNFVRDTICGKRINLKGKQQNMKDPDAVDFNPNQEIESPQETAFMNGQYVPGIVLWMSGQERDGSIAAIKQKSDDPEWQRVAIESMDEARGYDELALERLAEAGIEVPPDDQEYVAITSRPQDTNR